MGEPWPDFSNLPVDQDAGADFDWVIRLVSEIRTLRAEMNVPPGARYRSCYAMRNARTQTRLENYGDLIRRLRASTGSIC